MSKKISIPKKLIALILACLLIVGTLPAWAAEVVTVVVDPTVTDENSGTTIDETYECPVYNNISAAIDYCAGAEGKIYLKGTITATGAQIEGTTADRAKITIAGYGNSATNNIIDISDVGGAWLQGDLVFENITFTLPVGPLDSNGNVTKSTTYVYANGHSLEFGEGVVIDTTNGTLAIGVDLGSVSGGINNTYTVKSGAYAYIAAVGKGQGGRSYTMNTTINISGNPTISTIGPLMTPNAGKNNIYGDVTYNIEGNPTITTIYAGSGAWKGSIAVTGNMIFNINGGSFTNVRLQNNHADSNTYDESNHGNIAMIVDSSKVTKFQFGGYKYGSNAGLTRAAGKKYIAIINNNQAGTATFNNQKMNSTEESTLSYWNYLLRVTDGVAQPVFERTDDANPSTSTLVGFTITPNTAGLVPAINGVKLTPIEGKTTADGKAVYDLSAYENEGAGTATIDNIAIYDITFLDTRAPILTTDTSFVAPEGYKVVSTMADAITALGAEGGTIYIKGTYDAGNDLKTAFANTANIADGELITILGWSDDNTVATDNILNLGYAWSTGLNSDWLHCDLTLDKISVTSYTDMSAGSKAADNHGFFSNGNTITLGKDIVTSATEINVGGRDKTGTNNVIINGGTYSLVAAATGWINKDTARTTNVNYVINGGTVTELGLAIYHDGGGAATLTGHIDTTINGGNFTDIRFFFNANYTTYGNTTLTINGGTYNASSIGAASVYGPFFDGSNLGNVAVVVNAKSDYTVGVSAGSHTTREGKYSVAVINNYEVGTAYWGTNPQFIDYRVQVSNGKAEPVFSETTAPDDSVLLGFKITADEDDNTVVINGIKATPNENGVYPLSLFNMGNDSDTVINIVTFQKDMSKYVEFRNSFENSYEKLSKGETVNVVYFGGSMTAGHGSSSGNWRVLTQNWLNSTFADATINHYNCATGESGTLLGAYRNAHDVITNAPDIMFIEYSINDKYFGASYSDSASRFETIIREVKLANPDCDIVTVLVTDENVLPDAINGVLHTQAQAHDDIAEKYGIPSIYAGLGLASYFEGVAEEDLAAEWDKYSMNTSDIVHLNDTGYGIYFNVVSSFLEVALSGNDTKSYETPVSVDVTDPETIVSGSLFDGNRTIIDGEKSITVVTSDKARVIDTTTNLQTIIAASNAAGGTGFVYDTGSVYGAEGGAYYYPGSLKLAANTSGKLVVTFTGTEFAFYTSTVLSGSSFTYSVVNSSGRTVIDNATYTFSSNLAKNPIMLASNLKSDTYTVTINMSFTSDFAIGAVMHRDASKQTGEYNYGKYWVKYGGTGKGLSPDAPAKSVAWLINNVIADAHTADETIEIYIMQDDAEILYNSTAYVTDDESYAAEYVGKDDSGRHTAESHITAWTSSSDGTAKSHTATIVIKSYPDGDSATNYLAFNHNLGANAELGLRGPTVFDNIYTVSMRKGYTGIYANGHDMEFTANYGSYNVPVGEYEAYTQWDGTFVKQDASSSTATGSNWANPSYSGNGGRVVYNSVYNQYGGILIGTIGNATTAYTGDTVVVLNNPLVVDENTSEGTTVTVATSATTFGTISLFLNYKGIVNVKGATNADTGLYNATVTDGLQLIRNSNNSAKWDHMADRAGNVSQNTFSAIAVQNNVPFWDVQFIGDTPYLDTYEENGEVVLGKYTVTTSDTLIAFNKDTEKFVYSVDGILDLTGSDGGRFLVYVADEVTDGTLEVGDTVIATENVTVTISELEATPYEGKAFIGWQINGEFVKDATVALTAGDTLEAVYMDYNTDANGDFYIEGVQMRVDKADSIRFVVTMKDSILGKLSAAGATLITDEVAYGSLVLPTELTYGMDLVYGEAIVDRNGNTLGTPTIVPAEKIYADILEGDVKTGVQYTVAVTGVTGNKQIRSYSVQGYIRYIDANGNEQVLYSGYGQSSLYRAALRVAADETASETNKAAAKTVIDNVQGTVQQSYLSYVYGSTTTVENVLGLTNLTITNLANGFQVSDFSIDWNYNDDVADTVNTEVIQLTDTHLIYNNRVDNGIKNPAILSAGVVRNNFLAGDANAVRAMQFAMTGNKTIITGDVFDYLSDGCAQKANRLLFSYDVNYLGNFGTVGASIGNHEYTRAFGTVPDTGANVNCGTNYEWIQNNWVDGDDSIYEMEVVYNDNGKNPVMTITIHNGTNDYSKITNEIYAQFKADLASAREQNIPVLIFQHIPIATDGSAMEHVTDSTKADMTSFAAKASSSGRTGEMYNTITDNADIIKGIFCGHQHDYYYGTITGTDENATPIPQILFQPNFSGSGYALRINVQ